MSERYDIELRIRSHPRYLCVVRAMIGTALQRLHVTAAVRGRLALAVDEALANVIRHGYAEREDGPIWVRFTTLAPAETAADGKAADAGQTAAEEIGGVRIVIEDEARQVDPEQIRGRELSQVQPGGLGVHIIREVMDHVHYAPRPDKGMRLEMTRRVRSEDLGKAAMAEKKERR